MVMGSIFKKFVIGKGSPNGTIFFIAASLSVENEKIVMRYLVLFGVVLN